MNFLSGQVVSEAGHLYFEDGASRLRLPERMSDLVGTVVGRPMILGVRPECLSFSRERCFGGQDNGLAVAVTVVEPLGDKMDVHVASPTHEHIVARVEANYDIRDGMNLPMYLDMDRVHLFEPGDEGVNVSLTGAGDRRCATQLV